MPSATAPAIKWRQFYAIFSLNPTFEIAQVSGTPARSRAIDGVAEALVKSKKYLVSLAFLQPEVAGAIVVDYLTDDRARLPKTATAFVIRDWEVEMPNQHTASPIEGISAWKGQRFRPYYARYHPKG